MKGFLGFALGCCLLASPAAAENVLVNGELDDGFAGWYSGSEIGGCDAASVDTSSPGQVTLAASDGSWNGEPACVEAEQHFAVPNSGWYRISARFFAQAGPCTTESKRAFLQVWRPGNGHFWWEVYFYNAEGNWYEVDDVYWLDSNWDLRMRIYCADWRDCCNPLPRAAGCPPEALLILDYVRVEWDDAVPIAAASWSTVKALY